MIKELKKAFKNKLFLPSSILKVNNILSYQQYIIKEKEQNKAKYDKVISSINAIIEKHNNILLVESEINNLKIQSIELSKTKTKSYDKKIEEINKKKEQISKIEAEIISLSNTKLTKKAKEKLDAKINKLSLYEEQYKILIEQSHILGNQTTKEYQKHLEEIAKKEVLLESMKDVSSYFVSVSPKKKPNGAKKIRLFPTTIQKQKLRDWFGVYRWIYNKGLDFINKLTDEKLSIKMLRDNILNKDLYINENQWVLKYDYDFKDEALRELLGNYKTNLAKGGKFKLKFKSRKDDIASISVLSKKWNKENNFYSDIFNINNMKSAEPLPESLQYTCRLKKINNKYYLCLPQYNEINKEQRGNDNVISIDPGCNNFLSGFDPKGYAHIIGYGDIERIGKLRHYNNKLKGKISKSQTHKKRYALKKALKRAEEKIHNLVSDMHKKVIKWLCENYNVILISRLNFHNMKNLNKKSKEKIATYRHCEFLNKLITKAKEYKRCNVIEVNEAFTSKTCCNCGNIKQDLGANKTYKCDKCKFEGMRDLNGAINILLRYLSQRAKLIFSSEKKN